MLLKGVAVLSGLAYKMLLKGVAVLSGLPIHVPVY